MIQTRIITEKYDNGEMQRYQVTGGFSWKDISFVTPPFSKEAYDEFVRLYSAFIVPKHPSWYGALLLFHISSDIEVPFHDDNVSDPQLAFSMYLENLISEGRIRKAGSDVVIDDVPADSFVSLLKKRGFFTVVSGEKDSVTVLPISDAFGFLSDMNDMSEVAVNSHFFTMDVFDRDSPYDKLAVPFGLALKDSKVIQPPLFGREALLVGFDGKCTVRKLSPCDLSVTLGKYTFTHGVNAVFHYRPFSRVTETSGGTDIVIIGRKVIAIRPGGGTVIPSSGFVIHTDHRVPFSDQEVEYHGLEDYVFGIQVGPAVMIDDVRCDGFFSHFYDITSDPVSYPPTLYPLDFAQARAARIVLAVTDKDEPVFIWAEGASKLNYDAGRESAGASLSELAAFCQRHGYKHAVNLDGGGSAGMFVNGEQMMHVSGRNPDNSDSERPVPMGLKVRV